MYNLTLATVGDLWGHGFSLIPIKFRDKRPACKWRDFQTRRPTFEELEAWFDTGTDFNVGIVTGAVSGIIVIDCDSAEGTAWADANLPPTAMVTRTAKDEHRFYRHPGYGASAPVEGPAVPALGQGCSEANPDPPGASRPPSGSCRGLFGNWIHSVRGNGRS